MLAVFCENCGGWGVKLVESPHTSEMLNSSTYFFVCFYFHFYFPTLIRPLTPFTVSVRLTYLVT